MTKPTDGNGPKDRKPKAKTKPTAAASAAFPRVVTLDGIPIGDERTNRALNKPADGEPVGQRLTAKQEAFCQHVATGMTLSAAYRAAYGAEGWADESVWSNASKLAANTKVRLRIEAEKDRLKPVTPHDPGEVKAKIIRTLTSILEDPQSRPADRMKAAELLGRWGEVALFDDRSTVKVETTSPEQAVEAITEKLRKLAQG